MHRRDLLRATALSPVALAAAEISPTPVLAETTGVSLDDVLQPYLARYNMPALAAAVVVGGSVVAAGAVGTRRVGTDIPVTLDDRFHIGSCTKAMTATLAATFVEQGSLQWDSTIGEVFPELAETMDAGLRSVTLEQLLSHTSGIRDEPTYINLLLQSYFQPGNLNELRYWVLQQRSTQPLQSSPGSQYAYSNAGYLIAGAMLERTEAATWEELVVARLFEPLGLETAGFGPQSSVGRVDAPLGNLVLTDGTLKAILAGPNADNPLIHGPAGTVHCSILDFAVWAGWNAGEGWRGPALVSPETLRKLHTKVIDLSPQPPPPPGDLDAPPQGGYALGWVIGKFAFSPEPFVWHNGTNTMNFAMILLQPKRDFALVLATNVFTLEVEQALSTVVAAQLYRRFVRTNA